MPPPEDIARYRKKYLAGWDAMREDRWLRLKELKISGTSLSAIERDSRSVRRKGRAIGTVCRNDDLQAAELSKGTACSSAASTGATLSRSPTIS